MLNKKKNKGLFFTGIALLILISNLSGFASADAPQSPGLPTSYWGTASINNTTGAGTPVAAYGSDGVLLANTTTLQGGQYRISIPRDDPATSTDEGAVSGENITFKLNGIYAIVRSIDEKGTNNRLDISISGSGSRNYDLDGNGLIDRSEAEQAVRDYFNDKISREEAINWVRAYFNRQ